MSSCWEVTVRGLDVESAANFSTHARAAEADWCQTQHGGAADQSRVAATVSLAGLHVQHVRGENEAVKLGM